MTDLLSRTLQQLADEAEAAPHLGPRLAETALHRAVRVRRRRVAAGGTGLITAGIAVALAATWSGPDGTTAAPRHRTPMSRFTSLPANSPAQLAFIRACLTRDPTIMIGSNGAFGSGRPGTRVADFRILATSEPDALGRTVWVGSTVAHLPCYQDKRGRPGPFKQSLTAHAWNVELPLSNFPNNVSTDNQEGFDPGTPSKAWEMHLAGRTAPGVTRITFTARGKTLSADVTDHFFIVRRAGYGRFPKPTQPFITTTTRLYDHGHLLASFPFTVGAMLFSN